MSISDPTATEVLAAIKTRLQGQHEIIWKSTKGDSGEQVRLSYRAELDALWAAVEVLGQLADGSDRVRVPDYFTD